MTRKEQQIINEFVKVLDKHRKLGPLVLIELFRIAYEKEISYGMSRTKPRSCLRTSR
jgi:hypothetical protein